MVSSENDRVQLLLPYPALEGMSRQFMDTLSQPVPVHPSEKATIRLPQWMGGNSSDVEPADCVAACSTCSVSNPVSESISSAGPQAGVVNRRVSAANRDSRFMV
ncbi:hypothetical protein D7Y15_19435 [Corallococcus sp. AB030]|nr:hypothetical protein D7Y15_19435 [Corallococcus sp. AB030]